MKHSLIFVFVVSVLLLSGFTRYQGENVEFICLKTHKASNTCHFNFKVDGANFRYVDVGCKYSKKQNELIKKVKDGSLFLAKDWKIPCPEPKEQKQGL